MTAPTLFNGGAYGSFSDKIKSAIASAQAREAAYAADSAAAAASPPVPVQSVLPAAAQIYGDMSIIPIVFAGLGDLFVLERPKNTRIFLTIVNTLAANPINFAFGRAADNVSGIPIPAAGNVFFDTAVPQNDLHIFSPVAGTILVGYINT